VTRKQRQSCTALLDERRRDAFLRTY